MASSVTPGIAQMIVQYEWILEDVDEEPKTFASKMILFRGGKVFRVGLKNHVTSPVLFCVAIDLNKMGMSVKKVLHGIQDSEIGPGTMTQMTKEEIGNDDDGSLQLFTVNLAKQFNGTCETFVFRIHIEGSVPGYSYQLADRLAKNQLWAAVTEKNKYLVDVEIVVKGKTFSVHKAILAARSPIFANEFTNKKQPLTNDPQKIQINGVEPAAVEQFLHFIYTGESMGTLANEELLKLADEYQLKTLASLCRTALKGIETSQMVHLTNILHMNDAEIPCSFTIRPDKETEIFFDRTTPTFRCAGKFELSKRGKSECIMKYHNEDIFFVYFSGGTEINSNQTKKISKPVFHLSCSKHRKFGLKFDDVCCTSSISHSSHMVWHWDKMESKHCQKKAEILQDFTIQSELDFHSGAGVYFDIKVVSTIGNYYYEMMDDAWMQDIWTAATSQKLTDVVIFIGTVKIMEAHRVILSARSPVLKETFNKTSDTGKSVFTFDAEFDVAVVKNFLQFLYTGSLETSASKSTSHKQLLKLATQYEVETLKNMCQLAHHVPDVEELTNCLLQL